MPDVEDAGVPKTPPTSNSRGWSAAPEITSDGITDFEGRVAFVTGGARGIGLGIAKALLRRGANVAIADINQAALDQAVAGLGLGPDRLRAYRLDVTDREQYAAVAEQVVADLGNVSLLFNNAGVIDSVSPSQISYQMWDYVMGINLGGVYNGIQSFVPWMLKAPIRCHVVNTASEAGLYEAGSGFLYHSSKFAVVGLSESLRREFARMGVGVSVLHPGAVATDIVLNTRAQRPADSAQHSSRVTEILDTSHVHLNRDGADPDDVGEFVLDAVERDELYVATRGMAGGTALLDARTEAIKGAFARVDEVMAKLHPVA